MANNILISVIVSVYNSEKFFQGKIEDLLRQTILDKIEIIIINSGSLQNEENLYYTHFAKIPNIKYIKTDERETIYKAWNRGIKIAQGKYIINSNTDDRLKEDALEILSNELEEDPNIVFVYGDQYISNIPNENFVQNKKTKKLVNPKYDHLGLLSGYLAGSQPMWRSSLHFKDNIWFDENYEVAGDYDFICRVAEKYKIKKVNKFIGLYYRSDSNSNKEYQNLKLTVREADIIKAKYSKEFIASAPQKDVDNIKKLMLIYKIIPSKVFSIFNEIMHLIYPQKRVIPRYFIFYLYSLLKEKEGDYAAAKKACGRYLDRNLFLIESLYENLENR